MEKPVTQNEFWEICDEVNGIDLPKYGVPYDGASGMIFPYNIDHMLAAVERFPELHVVSYYNAFRGVNRFCEDAAFYCLATGNADPNISFTLAVKLSDWTAKDFEEIEKAIHSIRTEPMEDDPVMMATMNWILAKVGRAG